KPQHLRLCYNSQHVGYSRPFHATKIDPLPVIPTLAMNISLEHTIACTPYLPPPLRSIYSPPDFQKYLWAEPIPNGVE
ncbi:hypothetical protein AVEN_196294-1, partial [Araneus ventricosus]